MSVKKALSALPVEDRVVSDFWFWNGFAWDATIFSWLGISSIRMARKTQGPQEKGYRSKAAKGVQITALKRVIRLPRHGPFSSPQGAYRPFKVEYRLRLRVAVYADEVVLGDQIGRGQVIDDFLN